MKPIKVLVCGSRKFTAAHVIADRIAQLPSDCLVMHGGARGADRLANDEALARGLRVREFVPDWPMHGARAGLERNLRMLDEKPDLVIAFWDGQSTGTMHTVTNARQRGIAVEVIEL